jgi:hypothetical protein
VVVGVEGKYHSSERAHQANLSVLVITPYIHPTSTGLIAECPWGVSLPLLNLDILTSKMRWLQQVFSPLPLTGSSKTVTVLYGRNTVVLGVILAILWLLVPTGQGRAGSGQCWSYTNPGRVVSPVLE